MYSLLDSIYNLLSYATEDAIAHKLWTPSPELLEALKVAQQALGEYLDKANTPV